MMAQAENIFRTSVSQNGTPLGRLCKRNSRIYETFTESMEKGGKISEDSSGDRRAPSDA